MAFLQRLSRRSRTGVVKGLFFVLWLCYGAGAVGSAGAPVPGARRADLGWVGDYAKFAHYTVDDGMSQNTVYTLLQDRQGFVWMGTQDGLNRFDGKNFRVFRPDIEDPFAISGRVVTTLMMDDDGHIWAGTQGDGLCRYDVDTGLFETFRQRTSARSTISSDMIYALLQDGDGSIWVGTENGLNRREGEGWRVYNRGEGGLPHHAVHALAEDDSGRIWIGTEKGLSQLDPKTGVFDHWTPEDLRDEHITALVHDDRRIFVGTTSGLCVFNKNERHFIVPENLRDERARVDELLLDREGMVWVAAADQLLKYNPKTGEVTRFRARAGDAEGLSGNIITALLQDDSGIIWVGTEASGLNKLNPYSETFVHVSPRPGGLPHGTIIYFYMDSKQRFWITTDGGGMFRFDPDTGRFFDQMTHDPLRPEQTPSDNNLWSISEDAAGAFWIPTRNGLNRFEPDTGKWQHFKHDPNDPESLSVNKCFSAMIDNRGRVWVAAFGSGLDVMDQPDGKFRHYRFDPENPRGLAGGMVLYVDQDRSGRIWAGTFGSGLNRYNEAGDDWETFRHVQGDPTSLAEDSVGHIFHDSRDRVWFSTGRGISWYHPEQNNFSNYGREQGLADEITYAIIEDDAGFLWVSTNGGLSRFDPDTEHFINFDPSHNLQSNEFNQMSALKLDGLLYFGGVNGFNIFDPTKIKRHHHKPPIVITAFKKFNEPAHPGRPIETAESLTLNYDDKVISFELAALDFLAPQQNRFSYRLEGFSDSEIELGTKTDLTFTNLDPGNYTLYVSAANADGIWNHDGLSLPIEVVPPAWRTPPAYAFYVLCVLALMRLLWHYQLRRLEQAENINSQLLRLDRIKDEFLANTSHELRTPLGGMIGIAESLLEGAAGSINPILKDNLDMIVSNGRRLDTMVCDLLDFSKMKHESLVLEPTRVDMAAMIRVVATLFKPLLDKKPVTLVEQVPDDLPYVLADENRLQQILYNLLDNAVKFTAMGEIRISARQEDGRVVVAIFDSGIGIPSNRHREIFTSFQKPEELSMQEYAGSGLGLAVTRRLVQLHGGEMTLESTEGVGSCFSFSLPLANGDEPLAEADREERPLLLDKDGDTGPAPDPESREGFNILVVDDERVNRHILNNLLTVRGYHVVLASEGEEALKLLEGTIRFDLVLLDIVMPRMTGYDVCRTLRRNWSLQELPVIFLTAKNQAADLKTGFELGANDYLPKPFSKDELLSRVRMHLNQLDTHRNLEAKVARRTIELERQNKELEAINLIVQSINRELHMEDLLQAILVEGVRLFPQSDSGSFLLLDSQRRHYLVAAAHGYPKKLAAKVRMSTELVDLRYKQGSEQLSQDIYIVRNPSEETRPEPVRSLNPPKALLVMEVKINESPEGLMVLDHSESSQGFDEGDVRRLQRFREHVISALSRARTLENLARSQRDLVDAAHMFGMADNASMVLHNLGNKLNSVNTSVQMLQDQMTRARWPHSMERTNELLESGPTWLADDPGADQFRVYLNRLFGKTKTWRENLDLELNRLAELVSEVLLALRAQWDYTTIESVTEPADLASLLQSCARQGLEKKDIELVEQYRFLPKVPVQKVKLMRVFFCLLENAVEAIGRHESEPGRVVLRTYARGETAVLEIEDNGRGIDSKHRDQLFTAGFSTKSAGAGGFGLHNCANAVLEMGGTLQLTSEGPGKGANATITLPIMGR